MFEDIKGVIRNHNSKNRQYDGQTKRTNNDIQNTTFFNMNAFFSFDLFLVYIPECKQQLRTMKIYTPIPDIGHFKSGLYIYYSQRAV